ncbi:MAG: sensor histidine kinase [Geobacteraceae bacterium]|jgi:PAS domain S-box-containing protein
MNIEEKKQLSESKLHDLLRSLLHGRQGAIGRKWYLDYLGALAATVATLLIGFGLADVFDAKLLILFFLFPVMLSAHLGGLGPGLASTALSALLVDYFLTYPIHSLDIAHKIDFDLWALLLANGIFISVLTGVLHRMRLRSENLTAKCLLSNKRLEEDILERNRVEAALRERENRLLSIFLAAPVGIGMVVDRHLMDVNDTLCRMTGYSREEMLGKSARMLYSCDENYEFVGREKYRQIAEKVTGTVETYWRRKDGNIIHIILSSTPLDRGDLSKGVTFTALDITDRKGMEDQLRNSLKEKEILLREVHHRVKNNLQVIFSLIDWQSDYIQDPDSLGLLKECQNRIQSMALVHEELYRAKDFANFDFGEYIKNLVGSLYQSYMVPGEKISFTINAQNIALEIDQAIPCGMIINELVSNAIKHAFPDGRSGTICVEVQECGEQQVLLAVADNGVGLPSTLDHRGSETLGLQLVCLLAEQLHGKADFQRENGTRFEFVFQRN